jgi:hypothetical protein
VHPRDPGAFVPRHRPLCGYALRTEPPGSLEAGFYRLAVPHVGNVDVASTVLRLAGAPQAQHMQRAGGRVWEMSLSLDRRAPFRTRWGAFKIST